MPVPEPDKPTCGSSKAYTGPLSESEECDPGQAGNILQKLIGDLGKDVISYNDKVEALTCPKPPPPQTKGMTWTDPGTLQFPPLFEAVKDPKGGRRP